MSTQKIQFGSKEIQYDLEYQQRKTLGISVLPDRRVLVKAPLDSDLDKIEEKVHKRAPWILQQQEYFLSFEPLTPPRNYVSGESHLYMGRQYRLKVRISDEENVKLKRGYLEVHTSDKTNVESLTKDWYKDRAKIKFPKIAEKWIVRFKKYGVEPTDFIIKWMDKRWGSCTPKGKIILNVELIKAPKRCIEYVILHELCHLVHHNHSTAFFKLQTREMDDWSKWKDRLERIMA